MGGDGTGTDDGAVRSAEASYVSTEAIIARETAVLARDLEQAPGHWRPLAVRHALATVAFVGVVVWLGSVKHIEPGPVVRTSVAVLVAMVVLTGVDVVGARRRLRASVRSMAHRACPPGTLVRARYTESSAVFLLPWHEVHLDLATVTAARHTPGVLLLDQAGRSRAWAVPDELLGDAALAVLRDALGARYRRASRATPQ
ncbi:MAG: hypothetical protein IE926_12070 [Micrococcales bacterium]|nr:hypothetical protein [Micrococcales bacterium]